MKATHVKIGANVKWLVYWNQMWHERGAWQITHLKIYSFTVCYEWLLLQSIGLIIIIFLIEMTEQGWLHGELCNCLPRQRPIFNPQQLRLFSFTNMTLASTNFHKNGFCRVLPINHGRNRTAVFPAIVCIWTWSLSAGLQFISQHRGVSYWLMSTSVVVKRCDSIIVVDSSACWFSTCSVSYSCTVAAHGGGFTSFILLRWPSQLILYMSK